MKWCILVLQCLRKFCENFRSLDLCSCVFVKWLVNELEIRFLLISYSISCVEWKVSRNPMRLCEEEWRISCLTQMVSSQNSLFNNLERWQTRTQIAIGCRQKCLCTLANCCFWVTLLQSPSCGSHFLSRCMKKLRTFLLQNPNSFLVNGLRFAGNL